MKWLAKWRERREMKRLIDGFESLREKYPRWGGADIVPAFQAYCELEALGPERVRAMLARNY